MKTELLRFLDDLGLGKVNRGKRISPARQLKYLHALRAPLEFFNKPTVSLALRDIETFERALGSGRLANRFTGKPFAHSTQVDMRMLLKIFLRWRLGPAKADALTGWLDTRHRPKTPDFLKEAEVERLYQALPQRRTTIPDRRALRQRRPGRGIPQHPLRGHLPARRERRTSSRSPSSRNTPRRWAGRLRCIGNARLRP